MGKYKGCAKTTKIIIDINGGAEKNLSLNLFPRPW